MDGLLRQVQADAQGQARVGLQALQQALQQRRVAVGGFDEYLRLAAAQGQGFELANALRSGAAFLWQVAHKGKLLPIEPAGGQRQHQRHRPHQGRHGQAQLVRGTQHRGPRVGNAGHAGLAHQPDVVPLQGRGEQGGGVVAVMGVVIALFVHLTRQFDDLLGLQRLRQRHHEPDPFQKGARAFGVFAHPVRQAGSGLNGVQGQAVL